MHVLFNSDRYHIVEYAGDGGFEVFSKDYGRIGFIRGDAADALRRSIEEIVATGTDAEAIDDVLETYDALLTQTTVLH